MTDICLHCGAPVIHEDFCCRGCEVAYGLINESGLGNFYERMIKDPTKRLLKPEPHDLKDIFLNVKTNSEGQSEIDLMVEGLHCAACVWLIEMILSREPNMLCGRINFTTHRLHMAWTGGAERAASLIGRLEALGFRLTPYDPVKLGIKKDLHFRDLLICLAISGFAAGNVMLLSVSVWAGHDGSMDWVTRDFLHWLSALIAMPAIIYAGRPFYRSAWQALSARRTNMDVPISIGVLLATFMSLSETIRHGPYVYFDSALTLIFFLLIGRVMDHRARGRTREAAEQLLSLGVSTATRIYPDGHSETIASSKLVIGDRLLVTAGERIAADGVIETGTSDLDTSLVTGETMPLPAQPGTQVFAGTVNLSAPLVLSVSASGDGTLLAEIVRMMEVAEGGRARYRLLTDRLASWYAPFVHSMALITFFYWFLIASIDWQIALLQSVSVLIITCPCALALAVPVVQIVASSSLFRRGILLKSATALERLAVLNHVVFDKTGTITSGRLTLQNQDSLQKKNVEIAASLAFNSLHPLSRVLQKICPDAPLRSDVIEVPGCGLQAEEESGSIRLGSRQWLGINEDMEAGAELWLQKAGEKPIRFSFADPIRSDARQVISRILDLGISVEILSGDRLTTVSDIAEQVGISKWQALVTPGGKASYLATLKEQGKHVLMVGDGINDAPALAMADVSMSPSNAADIAKSSADIILQGDKLAPVYETIMTAKKAANIVKQNVAIALLYNIFAVPMAMAGMVTPPIAAAAMSSSSIIVVINALRMFKNNGRKRGEMV